MSLVIYNDYIDASIKIEGLLASGKNKEEKYTNLKDEDIFYSISEIGLVSKRDGTKNGVFYKIIPLHQLGFDGFECIEDIDTDKINFENLVQHYFNNNRKIDIGENVLLQIGDRKDVILETSVIFFGLSTEENFTNYKIIYIDQKALPEVDSITVEYHGEVEIGNNLELDKIYVIAKFTNEETSRIISGFTVEPSLTIENPGQNIIYVVYIKDDGTELKEPCEITGVRAVDGLFAEYDGPILTRGQKVERKHLIVTAHYTDGTSKSIADYTLPNGNVLTEDNNDSILIYYKSQEYTLKIQTYDINSASLTAYYMGGVVEVGKKYKPEEIDIKVHYFNDATLDGYYEPVNYEYCVFSKDIVTQSDLPLETTKANIITVSYETTIGEGTDKKNLTLQTKVIIPYIENSTEIILVEAEYTGPDIYVNQSFSPERVICKVHYSNGSIKTIKNFTLETNKVLKEGINTFTLSFQEEGNTVTTEFSVTGLASETTTKNNMFGPDIKYYYPEMHRTNNRYRGPFEFDKMQSFDDEMFISVQRLVALFDALKQRFDNYAETIQGTDGYYREELLVEEKISIKHKVLNNIKSINNAVKKWAFSPMFATGEYKE